MRRLALLAAVALVATPALAQTQQQRARAAQGQTQGQAGTADQAGEPAAPGAGLASTASRAEALTTQAFAREVAMSDRFEVAASRLAMQRSGNAEVRRFAERMVAEHEKTAADFERVLAELPGRPGGATAPRAGARHAGPEANGLDQQHQGLVQQLEQAQGADFDRAYVGQQVAAHQQAVDLVRNYASSGDNARLRQWATTAWPALQNHLQTATQLRQATQG